MKIYKQEIDDGLQEALANNNTLAWCSVAETYQPSATFKSSALDKLIAENQDQMDLYYLKSILVSTGWNKNDDVFDPKETWAAKNTPEDKPFNFMHNEKDIIGHITGNVAVDFEGVELDSGGEFPKQFNILTTSVIYTEWSDSEQRDRMTKIIAEIEDGKWFVSMECLFPNFDYALLNESGQTSVVPRNEASAFLTKHLRSYGGNGTYDNYRVGRLLRNLSFSGKGLVSKPANPRSVILDGNKTFDESEAKTITISSLKESKMSDSLDKQITDLHAELAEAKTANKELQEQLTAGQQEELQSKIVELEASLATKQEEVDKLIESVASLSGEKVTSDESTKALEEKLSALAEDLAKKDEALAVMQQKEIASQRKAQLEEIGLQGDEAIATVEKFSALDDDTFGAIVSVLTAQMKKKGEWPPKKKDEDKEEEAPAMKKKAELDEEVDSAEASDEVLENAEESAEVAIAEAVGADEPQDDLRAIASEWLGSVLQSVPVKE